MNTARKFTKGKIAPRHIKAIHAAINKLGLDDDAYRAILMERYKVASCTKLTWSQAEDLLDSLNGKGLSRSPVPGPRSQKYADLDGRPGFASGAQCRFIAAMFHQVTRAEDPEAEEKALNSFCNRIANVAGLRMVRGWQVEKIIKALESMGAIKKENQPC